MGETNEKYTSYVVDFQEKFHTGEHPVTVIGISVNVFAKDIPEAIKIAWAAVNGTSEDYDVVQVAMKGYHWVR